MTSLTSLAKLLSAHLSTDFEILKTEIVFDFIPVAQVPDLNSSVADLADRKTERYVLTIQSVIFRVSEFILDNKCRLLLNDVASSSHSPLPAPINRSRI